MSYVSMHAAHRMEVARAKLQEQTLCELVSDTPQVVTEITDVSNSSDIDGGNASQMTEDTKVELQAMPADAIEAAAEVTHTSLCALLCSPLPSFTMFSSFSSCLLLSALLSLEQPSWPNNHSVTLTCGPGGGPNLNAGRRTCQRGRDSQRGC